MSISINDFLKLKNISLIDLRSIEKYNDNHIGDAINIPYLLLTKDPSKYINKNVTYYVYCQYGVNSYKLCIKLNKLGYKVIHILGGYEAWCLSS